METNQQNKIDAFFRLVNLNPTKTNKALFFLIILFLGYGLYRVCEIYERSNRLHIQRLERDYSRVVIDNYRLQSEVKDCRVEKQRDFDKIIDEYKELFERNKRIEEESEKKLKLNTIR